MSKHRQTATDLDNCYEQDDPEAIGEMAFGVVLACVVGGAIGWAFVHWWL